MSYKLVATPSFSRELKKLRKKYPTINSDLESLGEDLLENPRKGSEVYKNCYKVRFSIKSKGKGKSGGGRLITYLKVEGERIYLLSVYDKSDQGTITDSYIKSLLRDLNS